MLVSEDHIDDAVPAASGQPVTRGWVHSYETSAGQDGPGWRFLLFLSGCVLRCLYCHNPDTWHRKHGKEMDVEEIIQIMARYRPMLKTGGITVSGGEPLVQAGFVKTLFRRLKADWGIHTALDTSGFLGAAVDDQMMDDIDMVLLDIKSWNPTTYKTLTQRELEPTLNFARRLAEAKKAIWLRYVLVPGYTDVDDDIRGLAEFAASLGVVERVDVLPFHQLGRSKWHELGIPYALEETLPPSRDSIERTLALFREKGLKAV